MSLFLEHFRRNPIFKNFKRIPHYLLIIYIHEILAILFLVFFIFIFLSFIFIFFIVVLKLALISPHSTTSYLIWSIFSAVNMNDPCGQTPAICLNGATCVNTTSSYNCTCAPGWMGTHCEQGQCPQGHDLEMGLNFDFEITLFTMLTLIQF